MLHTPGIFVGISPVDATCGDAVVNYRLQDGQKNNAPEGEKYSLRGLNKDNIEVYETSNETKALPYSQRMQHFLSIMENEYKGRIAKFERNGHVYYAAFDEGDINKNIYGDKKSDTKGWKAKFNVGADGNIFEHVENAKYNGSKDEAGRNISTHRGVNHWDYFVKNVQIDGSVYDLVANVRKKTDNAFVYSIQLRENKKIKASPPLGSLSRALDGVPNASMGSIRKSSRKVNSLSDQTETDSFEKWFGDWQNNPAQNSNIRFSQRIGTKEWTERILQYRQGQQLPLYKMPCFLSGKECIKNSKIFAGFLAISMLLWYSFL